MQQPTNNEMMSGRIERKKNTNREMRVPNKCECCGNIQIRQYVRDDAYITSLLYHVYRARAKQCDSNIIYNSATLQRSESAAVCGEDNIKCEIPCRDCSAHKAKGSIVIESPSPCRAWYASDRAQQSGRNGTVWSQCSISEWYGSLAMAMSTIDSSSARHRW